MQSICSRVCKGNADLYCHEAFYSCVPLSRLACWLSGRFWAWVWWILLKLNFRSILGVWGFAKWGERMTQWWHKQAVWIQLSQCWLGWPTCGCWCGLSCSNCSYGESDWAMKQMNYWLSWISWLLSPVVLPGKNTHAGWTLILYLSVLFFAQTVIRFLEKRKTGVMC